MGGIVLGRVLAAFAHSGNTPDDDQMLTQYVLEQLAEAAFLLLPRSGVIVTVNGRAAALTGWTRAELLQLSPAEIIAAPMNATVLESCAALEPGSGRRFLEVPLHTRSGRMVKVNLRLSALPDAGHGEKVVLALATSVDERLELERERQQWGDLLDLLDQFQRLTLEVAPEPRLSEAMTLAQRVLAA